MNEHIDELLPFYVNGSLAVEASSDVLQAVEAHLAGCAQCQAALREWEELARVVRVTGVPLGQAGSAGDLPALSPLVLANLRRKPSFSEAVLETASLILTQRTYLKESWLLQTILAVCVTGVLAGLFLPVQSALVSAAPFFFLVPLLAVLGIGFLVTREDDLGDEIVAATPTPPGVLTFARLTLALGVIAGLALAGSLIIAVFGGVSPAWLVMTWLGPMLWLAALTTLLALLLSPWTAAGISITLWGVIALLLVTEEGGMALLGFSLKPLLSPSGWLFGGQVAIAAVLWLACWLWLHWGAPPALRLERGG